MTPEGLLGGMFKGTALQGLTTPPKLTDQEFVIEMTQAEFQAIATQNTPASARGSVKLELHEGKLTIRVKLF